MSWSDGRELRGRRDLARRLETRWGNQLGSYGQLSIKEYDSDDGPDVPQDLIDSKSHTFKTKVFKHPNTCQVCNEVIWNEGRTCRVCKYACHRKCEYKVTAACKPSVNYALPSNGDTRPQQTQLKFSSPPLDSNRNKMTAHVHAEVAKHPSGGDAYIRYSFDLDVDYITERLIAVSFPAGGLEAQYRSNLRDVVRMLRSKHQDKYVVFNLSQRRHDINQLNPQVYDLGWPDHLAPSLEKLCSICKHIETWLKADPHNIVVLHCKGGRGPIGVVVLAYMNYINITSNLETAMDRYAMKRFMEAKTESAMHPSQHRYVNYFTGLLTKSIQVNSAPLFLHHVLIHGVPNYDINGGCRPFLRVYQGMQPIFTSGVYSVPEGTSRFAVSLDQALPIRGDILVKCYHKKFRATTRDVVFRCQFHTTAIMECRLVFQKSDLDDACTDARFPDFTKVEFIFSHTPDQLHGSDYVPGNNFPVDERNDPLIRWDSYENFDKTVEGGDYTPEVIDLSVSMNNNIPHSSAPDGSLYAEVQKTPSPIQQEKLFFTSPSSSGPTSPVGSNQLLPVIPNALDFDTGPRSSMQTTQLAVLRAKMNAQMDPSYQTIKRRTPSPRTPTSDPPSPIQPPTPSVQFANGPQQPNNVELSNGPESSKTLAAQRREMNYKEKRDLDDLLRGIGEDVPALSSPDSIGSGEVGEKRKIVDVQAQMSHLPPLESRHSPTARVHHPQSHGVQGELENPYAEISDAVPKQDQLHGQVRKQDPLEEKITRSQVGEVESSRIPDVQVHRTAQLHDNPTYAVTKESKQYTPDSRPHDVADLGHGMTPGQQLNTSPGYPSSAKHSDIWQPQPLRAKKEQLMYIYQEDPTSPLGPAASPSPGDNAVKLPEGSDMTKTPTGSNRTSSEIGDDAMTWLQRQQQKLKEKRLREEAVTQPTYQTPKRELPKAPEPRQEPVFEKAPQAVVQPQVQAPREQMPTDNLSWLEEKQRELQMRRGQMDPSPKPLFIDTSHPGSSYGSSFSPPRTDFSGVSTSSAANGPLPRPQLTDLEKSTNEQFSPKATADPGPLTPPNTYEHDSGPHAEAWQAHRRPLNRQTSDITYDREQQVVVRQRLDMERAPQAPTHGVTSLPPAGPHSTTPKDSAGRFVNHSPTPFSGSRNDRTRDETQNMSHPALTGPAESSPGLSRDSGYASSLSSTVTGTDPVKSASVTRVIIDSDGSETTTTTSTQTRKKTIQVFPQTAGFDVKQLPVLFMQEIRKDESGGLQSRLLGLMKEKGVGGSPTLKRKPVSETCGHETSYRKPVVGQTMLPVGKGNSQMEGGGLLKTVLKESQSPAASHVLPSHNPSQTIPIVEITPITSAVASSSVRSSSIQSIPNHPSQSPRMSRYHSIPRSQKSNRHPRSVDDSRLNQSAPMHDLAQHSNTFRVSSQKQKSTKSTQSQVRSQSLPRNQMFKRTLHSSFQDKNLSNTHQTKTSMPPGVPHFTSPILAPESDAQLGRTVTPFGGPFYHSLPRDGPLHCSRRRSHKQDSNSASHAKLTFDRVKTTPSEFGSCQPSQKLAIHGSLPRSVRFTHDHLPNTGLRSISTTGFPNFASSTPQPKYAQYPDPNSKVEHRKQCVQVSNGDITLEADPAPFRDDTHLVQTAPSYNWVMDRIQTLRHTSLNRPNFLSSGKEKLDSEWVTGVKSGSISNEQPLDLHVRQSSRNAGSFERQGVAERVRGRPFDRYWHKLEGGSGSQSQDVWLRREDYDADQREPRALSADRLGTRSSISQQRAVPRQTHSGHPVGSHNVGTVPTQHLHAQSRQTNHSPTLSNAKPSSDVTPRVMEGVSMGQTNPNGNINLMAGLEDAIRMLSEVTHLQSRDPATARPWTLRHNTHVADVHRVGDLTGPLRQINPVNGWIGTNAKYQSNTQRRQQAPLQNASGPVRDAYKVDLHIDESNMEDALNHEGRVANRIADITSKQSDQPKSQPPTGPRVKPAKVKQVTRRTPYQSGYDSDSAINQYYDPPSNRVGRESPERWLHNPGGLPDHENEYWDRMEGLKTPNLKEQWIRKPEFDIESSNESLPNGSVTPKFPVGPKAYKNMIWTPLATVRPPHGPDDPYPLSPTRHNNRDILDTTGLHISPAQQASTQAASPVNVEGPTMNAAQSTTPATPEVITVTQRRIVQTERVFDQNGLPEVLSGPSAKEATVQQPIMAKVERVPTPVSQVERKAVQNGQHYPVEARVERVPVASVQESSVKAKPVSMRYPAGVFPPSPKKEVTFQDARGGVPERPTGPQALVEEKEIVPTVKKPVEVAPVWPIELEVHIKNEGISPAVGEVQVKSGVATPPNRPQQLSPSSQNRTQFVQEPPTQQEVIKKEQTEPKFSYQLQNLASQPPPPLYPTYSDRMKNRPPGPMYPTFSDRHRKAAAGRVEEVSPQVANGYHTMYDNRGVAKAKRASTGSEGMWPAHPTHQRKASDGNGGSSLSGRTTPSNFYLMQQPSPYSSSVSLADTSMDKVRFVKDLSAWWYKPHISRDEAIAMLKDKCPGQFVVRDSNSFPGAFGLAVKVAQLPPNAPPSKKATDPASELVRHFLIEPNPRGVRLKGCANEPIFGSLSALIYQHTLTQLALPCKLLLPESDPSGVDATDSAIDPKSAHALLSQGAACNVIFLGMMEMESLTGPSAVREATNRLINLKEKPKRVVVHFKVSLKGITLTDNQRKLFFRRHYPVQSVLYCGMDSGARKWKRKDGVDETQARIFGFISRKPGSKTDNQCHLFAEYEMEQPASAIVSFVTKVLLGSSAQS
ncbi:tensin-like isoform X3 [Acanthaster planci]|uniref:Tensin-like isoform X3 n=1 Tax=Acanthaster planci TaxID=133434 RepID=A0A8B7XGN6_ACAPL|nr:tensin-like isoform X3 [Acanthaster planci]